VPIHLASSFYDLDGFRPGASTLRPFEAAEAGDVAGKRLVHRQCHIDLDTLSWARRGALVSGLDFSGPAVAAASLAHSLCIDATFVVSDVYDGAAAGPQIEFLHEFGFDAFGGFGSMQWRDDGTYWLPPDRPRVPMIFSWRASLGRPDVAGDGTLAG
jgi:hypothetical protein